MKVYTIDQAKESLNFKMDYEKTLFKSVLKNVEVIAFDNKDYIIHSNTPIHYLYLLISGKAKIAIAHEDGTSSIVYFIKPMEMIGELTLIDIETQPKDVISIGESICLRLPMHTAETFLLKDPDFMLELSQFIGTKLLDRTWFNAKQQHYELKHRLAAHILLCESNGLYNEKHTETAEYLAVSYRHLLHTFKFFRTEGYVIKTKGGYTFDKEKLQALAIVLE